MNWHYMTGAEQKGPVSEADLTTLTSNGVVNNNTPVWSEGMTEWKPYGQVRPGASVATVGLAPPPVLSGGVVCAECGKVYPPSEVIRQGNINICANCKPVYVQKLREGVAQQGQLQYAGFGVRGGSVILDGILLYVVMLPVNFLLIPHTVGRGFTGSLLNFIFNLCLGVTYYVFFLGKYGATLGKMANKLLVVNPDGSKISYGKAFGRYFASNWISGLFTLFIGYLIAIWDDEKRALHDRICGTRVIRK